ncbi:hypothetical protein MRX96_012283 [Rhipicephalus microplus]
MYVYECTQDDMIRAEQKLQARLDRLGIVSELGGTEIFVSEVVEKVSDVVDVATFSYDTISSESEEDPVLSYLDTEQKLRTRNRIEIAALLRRLETRYGSGDSAAPPKEDNSELIR